jgi:hypothetical protein
MKNQYFGDVKDYLTYGLLRSLTRHSGLRIGVAWMLTPDLENGEGEQRAFLRQPGRWRRFDPPLFDHLAQVPGFGRRVGLLEEWGLLPGARFFYPEVPLELGERRAYFERLLSFLGDCPLLFFDPDVGIETRSIAAGRRSIKHIYWDEIELAFKRGHSLVIFQHFPRRPREIFLRELASALAVRLGLSRVDWFSTSHVAFFLAAHPRHAGILPAAIHSAGAAWVGEVSLGGIEVELPHNPPVAVPKLEISPGLDSPRPPARLQLRLLRESLAVCQLGPASSPPPPPPAGFYSLTRTPSEVSIVCRPEFTPAGARVEPGWRAFEVAGPLAFELVGILATLSGALARAEVSVFAISTFNTDYLLVKEAQVPAARAALSSVAELIP